MNCLIGKWYVVLKEMQRIKMLTSCEVQLEYIQLVVK